MSDRSPIHDALAELPAFRDVDTSVIAALTARASIRRFAKGQTLFRQGSRATGLYIVLEGEIRVVRGSRDRQHVIHHETRGGALGEVPLFDGTEYPATAIARTEARCVYVARAEIQRTIRMCPDAALFFLRRLSARVRTLVERVDGLATMDVGMRLAAYLAARAQDEPSGIVAITQEALAEELGTVREVVVRALRRLREAGLIRSAGRGKITVLDRQGLKRIAGQP